MCTNVIKWRILYPLGVGCAPAPYIRYAAIHNGDVNTHVQYKCDVGYWFTDKETTKFSYCQSDYEWSLKEDHCEGKTVGK